MSNDVLGYMLLGRRLTRSDASHLEEALLNLPGCLDARAKLLGYYSHHYFCCRESRMRRVGHINWMIANNLIQDIHYPFFYVHLVDRRSYKKIKQQFEKALKATPCDIQLLSAMAYFVAGREPMDALRLLEACIALEPLKSAFQERAEELRNSLPQLILTAQQFSKESTSKYFQKKQCDGSWKEEF